MKTALKAAFLVMCYVVSLSAESRASVYVTSEIIHYNWGGNDEMLGVAQAIIEYSVSLYYCTNSEVWLERYENDVFADYNYVNTNYACPWGGPPFIGNEYSQAETSLPFIDTSDYEVTGGHNMTAFYSDAGPTYYDPYGYWGYDYTAQEGLPITYPLGFSFLGIGGSPEWINYSAYILGYINAFREALSTTISGDPHHLRVDKDSFETTSCGGIRRKMDYAIVDNTQPKGKKVGRTPHREYLTFSDITCFQPGQFPETEPTACYKSVTGGVATLNDGNPIKDQLTAGCTYPSANCGASQIKLGDGVKEYQVH